MTLSIFILCWNTEYKLEQIISTSSSSTKFIATLISRLCHTSHTPHVWVKIFLNIHNLKLGWKPSVKVAQQVAGAAKKSLDAPKISGGRWTSRWSDFHKSRVAQATWSISGFAQTVRNSSKSVKKATIPNLNTNPTTNTMNIHIVRVRHPYLKLRIKRSGEEVEALGSKFRIFPSRTPNHDPSSIPRQARPKLPLSRRNSKMTGWFDGGGREKVEREREENMCCCPFAPKFDYLGPPRKNTR
jgi:hypothetical protein